MSIPIFQIKQGDEHLSSHSGLGLVGALLDKTAVNERVNRVAVVNSPVIISNGDTVRAMIGLCCLGKPDFDAIEPMREEPFFAQSLGLGQCPSSSTIRQRYELVKGQFDNILKQESASLIKRVAPEITPVGTEKHGDAIPLDIDVSPFDNSGTKKEGVSMTYKKVEGYAPIFSYLGQEGYLVNVELREGKQHCQNGTPQYLDDSIGYAKQVTDQPILVRLDSGNDCKENIKICNKHEVFYLIKRNLRKESTEEWAKLAKEEGAYKQMPGGEDMWYGDTSVTAEGFDKPLRIVYEVIERTVMPNGQMLLVPAREVNTYWTNLMDGAERVIELYHDHGTSEQFHSELKSDMNLERLPSGNFAVNSLVLLIGMVAYNLLRLCGQVSLQHQESSPAYRRKKTVRRRVGTVIQDLIYLACRIVSHSRRWILSFGRHSAWAGVWKQVYERFIAVPLPSR